MRCALVSLVIALAGCSIESHLVVCPDGTLCPKGNLCDPIRSSCIAPGQIAACDGLAEGATCSSGLVAGYCIEDTCIDPECGNGVMEHEPCDDGNLDDGDGCSHVCTVETCANGIVDVAGETCDDGNVLSHDGCDSRCAAESEEWVVDAITALRPGPLVYDAARSELLHISFGRVWRWDGGRWRQRASGGPTGSLLTVGAAFDPVTETVVVMWRDQYPQFWQWDGASWTARTTVGPGPLSTDGGDMTEGPSGPLLFTRAGDLWSLDVTTGVWTKQTSTTPVSRGFQIAYDQARSTLVVAIYGQVAGPSPALPSVIEWDGNAWQSVTDLVMTANNSWAVIYDPGVDAVIAVGGGSSATQVSAWNGTTWQPLVAMPSAGQLDVVYDRGRNRRVVTRSADVLEWDGVAWNVTRVPTPIPNGITSPRSFTYDARRDQLLYYGVMTQPDRVTQVEARLWKLNDTPHEISSAGLLPTAFPMLAFDPERDAVVVTGADTRLLRDDAWTMLASSAPQLIAATYDPSTRAVVGIDRTGLTWKLPSTGADWLAVDADPLVLPAPSYERSYLSLAFDAHDGQLVVMDSRDGATYELSGTTWVRTLSPGPGYTLAADLRRGTLGVVGSKPITYERSAGSWTEHPGPPADLLVVEGATYDPVSGELLIIGVGDSLFEGARLLVRRRLASSLADETCRPGSDDDGDGKAGCDDDDCWWSCTPTCPPFVTCPTP